MSKDKRVALITGAGTGIGRAVSLALLKEGWDLVLAGRRPDPLQAVAAEGDPDGERSLCVPTDVAQPDSVAALFAAIDSRFGRLDLLFNNAGADAPSVPLEELSYEDWAAVVGVNLTGAFLCTQGAFRLMQAQTPRGGRIINNGSVSASAPRPNTVPYTATKHAITGLTRATALDGRAYDIACGQIDIGNAETDMTTEIKAGLPQADGRMMAEPTMDVAYVAQSVVHMAGLPLDANVLFMTVMATKMPLVGRG